MYSLPRRKRQAINFYFKLPKQNVKKKKNNSSFKKKKKKKQNKTNKKCFGNYWLGHFKIGPAHITRIFRYGFI